MSQLEDINAIDAMFRRTKPVNPESANLRSAWITWFNGLRPYDKSSSTDTYKLAVKKRDAFFAAEKKGKPTTATAAKTPVASAPVLVPGTRPTIRKGSSGPAVTELQRFLGIGADGKFGSGTESTVIAWQKAHGLTGDGVVGPNTWTRMIAESAKTLIKPATPAAAVQTATAVVNAALKPPASRPTLRKGSSGAAVKELQTLLKLKADGAFGPATEAAVISFQRSKGLTADGIVGSNTWSALLAANVVATATPMVQQVTQAATAAAAAIKPPAVKPTPLPPAAQKPATNPFTAATNLLSGVAAAIPKPPALPAAVTETFTSVKGSISEVSAKTPLWVKAAAATGGLFGLLVGIKAFGKKRAA